MRSSNDISHNCLRSFSLYLSSFELCKYFDATHWHTDPFIHLEFGHLFLIHSIRSSSPPEFGQIHGKSRSVKVIAARLHLNMAFGSEFSELNDMIITTYLTEFLSNVFIYGLRVSAKAKVSK